MILDLLLSLQYDTIRCDPMSSRKDIVQYDLRRRRQYDATIFVAIQRTLAEIRYDMSRRDLVLSRDDTVVFRLFRALLFRLSRAHLDFRVGGSV